MTAGAPVNATQRRILAALGTYRLLNPQQMRRLEVSGSEHTIRTEATVLERKKLIGVWPPIEKRKNSRLLSGITCLPCMYWLTDQGAAILATGSPDDPLGVRREFGDGGHIMHRIRTVDAHIALRRWAAPQGPKVDWFVTDFEPGVDGRRKATTIYYDGAKGPRFTPDALTSVIGPDGTSRLLVWEIERGRRDAKRADDFTRKFPQLHEVSAGRVVEDHFYPVDPSTKKRVFPRARFLIVFATAELRDKALRAWPEPDANAWANFFVKCDDELADFNAGWWRPGGASRRPLFSFGPAPQGQTARPLPVVERALEAI